MVAGKQKTTWYESNRDEYNAVRRTRYGMNAEVREAARIRASNYRARCRKGNVKTGRNLTRLYRGKMVEVLSTGRVAEMLGRSPQMMRNWEIAGLIPASVFPDSHRLYTKKQARLLVTLLKHVQRNNGSWDSNAVRARIAHTRNKWR